MDDDASEMSVHFDFLTGVWIAIYNSPNQTASLNVTDYRKRGQIYFSLAPQVSMPVANKSVPFFPETLPWATEFAYSICSRVQKWSWDAVWPQYAQ